MRTIIRASGSSLSHQQAQPLKIYVHTSIASWLTLRRSFRLDAAPSQNQLAMNFLAKSPTMFYICSRRSAEENAECRAPSKPLRLPQLAAERSSLGALRAR